MENTHIEWADHTFNPWIGCAKVSPGCQHCYAEALNKRWRKGQNWGKGAPRVRTSAANWRLPLKWDRDAQMFVQCPSCGWRGIAVGSTCPMPGCLAVQSEFESARPRIFCASLADWLDDEVPIEWRCNLLETIHVCDNLDWLLLSKRPQNWDKCLQDVLRFASVNEDRTSRDASRHDAFFHWLNLWVNAHQPPSNIWIGTTVEDQARANERIPQLLAIPAKVRFLSCEPLLEAVRIEEWLISHSRARADLHERRTGHDCGAAAMVFTCDECGLTTFSEKDQRIHWVICGGESGPGARPMHPGWARSLRDQCTAAGVDFFFKQWGDWGPHGPGHLVKDVHQFPDGQQVYRFGKKTAGRVLDYEKLYEDQGEPW